jgi:hypothetical protein
VILAVIVAVTWHIVQTQLAEPACEVALGGTCGPTPAPFFAASVVPSPSP